MISDKQFQDIKAQLAKKKEKLGDAEYQSFLERAAQASIPPAPADTDGFVLDTAQGLAKSAGSTALGLGTLGRKIQSGISKAVGAVTGAKNFGMDDTSVFNEGSTANTNAKKLLERDTAGEKFGGFVGDVGQFAIPGTAVTKATKGASFLTRVGALASSDATVQSVQQGGFDRNTVDTAILSAVFPVVGKAGSMAKATLPSSKDAGGKVINSLIKPLLKDFAYGKNPGKAVAEEGITANTLDELGEKIAVRKNAVGAQIGEITKNSKEVFTIPDALNPIDEAITEAAKNPRTNSAIIRRLNDLHDDLMKVSTDATGKTVTGRSLENLTAQEVFDLKKEIGDLTRWTGNASDDEIVNRALSRTYGNLKGVLDERLPELRPLNERYGDLSSAEIATKYRDKIAARQNMISLTSTQTGTAAALVAAIASGGAVVPIIVGASAAGFTQAMKSPAAKTRMAAWLASAPQKEVQDAFTQAPWLRGALQTALFGEEGGDPDENVHQDKADY